MSRAGSICPGGAKLFAGASWAFFEATFWLWRAEVAGKVELPETALGPGATARLSELPANVRSQCLFLASTTSTSKGPAELFAEASELGAFREFSCAWSARDWR